MRDTLLLLPGLLCDATIWSRQIKAFEAEYEIRVPRFLGLDSLTAMAERALAEAPSGRLNIAGHSMGGRVAIEMHRLVGARIERMMLLDTAVVPVRENEHESRGRLVELARKRGMKALADAWLPPMLHPARLGDASLVAPLVDMICRATPEEFEGEVRAMLNRPDAEAELVKVSCPVSFLVGREDLWSPLEHHEYMHRLVPHSTLTIVEDAGHMTPVERPQDVIDAMRAWLAT